MSSERSMRMPTGVSGWTPSDCKRRAIRFARALSSRYVSVASSNCTATRSGERCACASTNSCTPQSRGYSRAVAFHSTSMRVRSAAVISPSDDQGRSAAASMPSSNVRRCPATRAMVASSMRARSYVKRRSNDGVTVSVSGYALRSCRRTSAGRTTSSNTSNVSNSGSP